MKFKEIMYEPKEKERRLFYCVNYNGNLRGGCLDENKRVIKLFGEETYLDMSLDISYINIDAEYLLNCLKDGLLDRREQFCLLGLFEYTNIYLRNKRLSNLYESLFKDVYVPNRANCFYNNSRFFNIEIEYLYNNLDFLKVPKKYGELLKGELPKEKQKEFYQYMVRNLTSFEVIMLNTWEHEIRASREFYKEVADRFERFNILEFYKPLEDIYCFIKGIESLNRVIVLETEQNDSYLSNLYTCIYPNNKFIEFYDVKRNSSFFGRIVGNNVINLETNMRVCDKDKARPMRFVSFFDIMNEIRGNDNCPKKYYKIMENLLELPDEMFKELRDEKYGVDLDDYEEFKNRISESNGIYPDLFIHLLNLIDDLENSLFMINYEPLPLHAGLKYLGPLCDAIYYFENKEFKFGIDKDSINLENKYLKERFNVEMDCEDNIDELISTCYMVKEPKTGLELKNNIFYKYGRPMNGYDLVREEK